MAHGILEHLVNSDGLSDDVVVVSSGTGTLDGYPATKDAVMAASRDGIDISDHHSTAITEDLVDDSDLILVMAYHHLFEVLGKFPEADGKVAMLKAFPDKEPVEELSVADPIGTEFENYMRTYKEIKEELKRAWPHIKKRINEKLGREK